MSMYPIIWQAELIKADYVQKVSDELPLGYWEIQWNTTKQNEKH